MSDATFLFRSSGRMGLAALLLLLAGCGINSLYREGMDLYALGRHEEGLAKMEQAMLQSPDDKMLRLAYLNARKRLVFRLLGEARAELGAGRYAQAEAIYRHVLKLDPEVAEAVAGISAVEQVREQDNLVADAKVLVEMGGVNELREAERRVDQVLRDNARHAGARALRQTLDERTGSEAVAAPTLRESFRRPVTLEFKEANLKQVLEVLSAHSGLNFIVDKDVPQTLAVSVFLRKVTVAEALELILVTNQLRYRVLNDASLLVFPDTAAKLSEHQELVVRNFYLTNAEAKQVAAMLKSVLNVKNVYSEDKLNMIIMRDTPAAIRLAERLVAAQDVAEPEVMLEVAVVEVSRSQLTNIGIQLPNQMTLTPLPSGNVLTLRDLTNLSSSTTGVGVGPVVLNAQDDISGANVLANPRIRTHNREKALIRIGDRVPVITTTATSTGFVSESVQYLDVGLKLEVEPVMYPNDEIVIKLALEVSSVTKEILSKAGSISYQVGTRNASTVLRLKDGETQMLGGLITDEDRTSANRFAGLGLIPILGRLFATSEKENAVKTELILSITPRVVRSLAPPANAPRAFWSGTESVPRLYETAPRPAIDAARDPDPVPRPGARP